MAQAIEPAPAPGGRADYGRHSRGREFFTALVKSPSGLAGCLIVCLLIFVGIFGRQLVPFDPLRTQMDHKLLPPMVQGHLMGTDELGRDVFSRVIVGARVSLTIGIVTAVCAGLIGTAVGVAAGYFRGWVDAVLMRLVDVQLSFPFILLVLAVNAVLGGGLRNIILSLIIGGWVPFARVVRSEVLALREKEFILACRSIGVPKSQIILRHILPNLLTPVIVLASLQVAAFIIAEASVSFFGFGVQPPQAAWGNMLSEGKDTIFTAWWMITFPGLAIVITALGVNLFGDWLRDFFDRESQ